MGTLSLCPPYGSGHSHSGFALTRAPSSQAFSEMRLDAAANAGQGDEETEFVDQVTLVTTLCDATNRKPKSLLKSLVKPLLKGQ